jgi:hypothetical protein
MSESRDLEHLERSVDVGCQKAHEGTMRAMYILREIGTVDIKGM